MEQRGLGSDMNGVGHSWRADEMVTPSLVDRRTHGQALSARLFVLDGTDEIPRRLSRRCCSCRALEVAHGNVRISTLAEGGRHHISDRCLRRPERTHGRPAHDWKSRGYGYCVMGGFGSRGVLSLEGGKGDGGLQYQSFIERCHGPK